MRAAMSALGGLQVDTRPLDELLADLSTTVRQHEALISNLPALESNQSELRRGLRKIELALSSFTEHNSGRTTGSIVHYPAASLEKNNTDSSSDCELPRPGTTRLEESKESEHKQISIRRRLEAVKTAVRRSNEALENANVQELRRGLVELNAVVVQLQSERRIDTAHSIEIENRTDGLNRELSELQRRLGSHTTADEFIGLTHAVHQKIDDTARFVKGIQQNFQLEISGTLDGKVVEMKRWFDRLEAQVKGKQSNQNATIALLAKETDLSALIENAKREFVDVKVRIDVVEESVINNEEVLLTIKQRAAFATFSKRHTRWKKNVLDNAWSKWRSFDKAQKQANKRIARRKRIVRKVLIRHWSRRKHNAWEIWGRFVENHRRAEIKRERVIKFVYSRMYHAILEPTHHAFKRWRRIFIANKVAESNKLRRISMLRNSRCEQVVELGEMKTDTSEDKPIAGSNAKSKYELVDLLDTFKNDPEGAIYTLSQEIYNIRTHDIIKLQRDFKKGQEALLTRIETSLSMEISSLERRASELENTVNEKFSELKHENTAMKTQVSELRNSLYGTVNRVKNIEKSHGERLEQLCEEKEIVDEKVVEMQSQLNRAQSKIKNLESNTERSQNFNNTLLQRINHNERAHKELMQSHASDISSLKGELGSIAKTVYVSNEKYSKLKDDCIGSRNELIQSKISSKERFDEIHDIIDMHGVRRPELNRIINNGILYEKNAKEKNYVGVINCVFDGSNRIDLPGNLASFAYNYAEWIAYEADNETIRMVVEGNKTEDTINIEDDTAERRQNLIDA